MPESAVPPSCQAIQECLPWYINATLQGEELERVLQHLAICADCQQTLTSWQDAAAMVHLATEAPPLLPAPRQHYGRLLHQIEALEAPSAAESFWWQHWRTRLGQYVATLWEAPRTVRWTLAATSLAVVLMASVLFRAASLPPATLYHTLSQPEAPQAMPGVPVRLVLADDMLERDLRALLLQAQATLVAGPSALGVYTVSLQPGGESTLAVPQRLDILRAHPKVRLAEMLVTP